jgi:hypothetical protein
VQAPAEDDWEKLDRVLRYLFGTRHMGLALSAGDKMQLLIYVDASYSVHNDMRSHSGLAMSLGKGAFYVKSKKQKLNTKSSTEAEIVGVSDMLPPGIWAREFLLAQGYDNSPAILYQDNKSTISLMEKGRSTSERTRHINIRFFFVTDRVNAKEIKIEYLPTGDMIADMLTKPLQGDLFRRLRKELLNWEE